MKTNRYKLSLKPFLMLLFLSGGLLFFIDILQMNLYNPPLSTTLKNQTVRKRSNFVIDTSGCRIPRMDPFDENVKQFISPPEVPICNEGVPPLFQANETSIFLINASLPAYNISDPNQLECCYTPFSRKEPEEGKVDDKIEYGQTSCGVSNGARIEEEFIALVCSYQSRSIYTDMFSFVPLKNTSGAAATKPRTPSVLVIGLDAVSRLNFHRQMPDTAAFLKQLGAVELLGYNKVGDNTFPNLIPVLTGLSEEELTRTCWPSTDHYFDNCSFIWKEYKRMGYTTAYGEDASWMGLFNFQRNGFRKQSVDYAYNYFSRWSEGTIGNSHKVNVHECIGGRMVYRTLLEYINKFVVTMDGHNLPYFGFFWGASLSHDYLNQPKLGDPIYQSFFKSLKDGGHLENTVLIFMSDHGIRWGGIRQTFQGRMEERLPFVFVVLPEWYASQQQMAYHNLKRNARRLTTPFDLHETLVDLLSPHELRGDLSSEQQQKRGISFFRPISDNRTCDDAAIAPHWCTCQQSTELEVASPVVVEAATFAVENMNQQLAGYAQCSRLKLDSVLDARLMTYAGNITNGDSESSDYMLTLRTLPGEGVFEVTLRFKEATGNHTTDNNTTGNYTVVGTISRLNLYGKQSSCMADFHLKLYCYCESLLRF